MTADTERGYEFFEHTADIGLRVTGNTLTELFIHAANGLVAIVTDESVIEAKETRPIALTAVSVEGLLRVWLTELIVWFDAECFVPASYELKYINETKLQGAIRGERFNPSRHAAGVEVKGVTYHQFRVERTDGGWQANVIFDV